MTVIAYTVLPGVSYEIDEKSLPEGWLSTSYLKNRKCLDAHAVDQAIEDDGSVTETRRPAVLRVDHIVSFEQIS